ncbi:TPA: hypothetical protein I7297_06390 [Vibrio parahaemolyticus]|nr:hypothetical protein [Vibrio parahaemolyticus]
MNFKTPLGKTIFETKPISAGCEFVSGYAFKSKDFAESGFPVIKIKNIQNKQVTLNGDNQFIPKSVITEKLNKFKLTHGDILIAMTGQGSVGRVGKLVLNDKRVTPYLNQRVGKFVTDPNVLDKDYLYYVISTSAYESLLFAAGSGSGQPNLSPAIIKGVEIPFPPIKVQESISKILRDLDEKVVTNVQMNQTLEQMAQAIFKSWFVDFDPVKAKMNGEQPEGMDAATASLFPEKLVESELGLIPEGWEVMGLPSGTLFREGPGILAKDFHEKGVPLIRLAGLKNGVSLLDGCNYLDPEKVDKKWKHFLLQEGDILLSSSASLGRVAEVTKQSENSIAYTGIIGFRPIEGVTTRKYLKYFIQSQNFQRQIEAFGVGSVLKHFGPTHLKKMWILLPPISIQDKFEQLVLALDEKIQAGLEQNQSLSSLRDTLLPKLLSGEIELDVAEVNTND